MSKPSAASIALAAQAIRTAMTHLATAADALEGKAPQKAPEAAPVTSGLTCVGCGKAMLHNPVCNKCSRGAAQGTRQPVTPEAYYAAKARQATEGAAKSAQMRQRRNVAAQLAPGAKAKGNQNGHCEAVACGKFLNRMGECRVHG